MLISGNAIQSSGVPPIDHSVRLRSAATAYFSRTPISNTNRKTFTLSFWGKLGSSGFLFDTGYIQNGVGANEWTFDGSSAGIRFMYYNGATIPVVVTTTAILRDHHSWYHIVLAVDTTQAVASDRVKIYLNGVLQTSLASATYPTLNQDTTFNSTYPHNYGRRVPDGFGGTSYAYKDSYIARFCLVDGLALTANDFGYTNQVTGQWVSKSANACKNVVDSGGNNSSMLDFNDGSTLITLFNDYSSKNNDWTSSGISLTAGQAYDWMNDTPTNNYPVCATIGFGATNAPQDGNLSVGATDSYSGCSLPIPMTGSWRCEAYLNALGSQDVDIGITPINSYGVGGMGGVSTAGGYGWGMKLGRKWVNGSATTGFGTAAVGHTVTLIYNADIGQLDVYNNAAALVFSITGIPTSVQYGFNQGRGGTSGVNSISWNFGQRPWLSSISTTAKAICTANIPAPSIIKPDAHFNTALYSGNLSTNNITSTLGPDFVWIKDRTSPQTNLLFDKVRGALKALTSNATSAESSLVNSLTSFNSNGFTLDAEEMSNFNGHAYTSWLWKAGGAAVTNNAGSITSQVSANTTAGFSIVTYTGTGANATVGHGLGVAPKMVIVKARNPAGAFAWAVWHTALAGSEYLILNGTAAKATLAALWNSTVPTSSVFSLGSDQTANENTKPNVAYCFAEVPGFSKIGSYTGNGSADGPFVYCGFRPKFVMIKNISSGTAADNWVIKDSSRPTYNITSGNLYANLSNAEDVVSTVYIDFMSTGFKIRGTYSGINLNTSSMVFIAFAEAPFKYSNAR